MSKNRFVQLHFLTSYPAALLNRDDAGFAKRIPFGGVTRIRISSQCLKRHWRTFEGEHSLSELDAPETIRSRYTFERYILEPLIAEKVDPELARAVTAELMDAVLGKSDKAKKKEEKAEEGKKAKKGKKDAEEVSLRTGQITVLGRPEVDYLLGLARKVCAKKPSLDAVEGEVAALFNGDAKENLKALRRAAGLGAAMFGRMVTSDVLARGDAAVHVAHAFTVHAEAAESDYFSAVDDLMKSEDQLGSGHIGNTELTSGLYYGYVVVDVPLLVSNLEGCPRSEWTKADRTLAANVVKQLVHLVATVSPGAKLGSTAPYAYACLVFAEVGASQPRTLANAFLQPVSEKDDVLANAYGALARHVQSLDQMYGKNTERRLAGLGDLAGLRDAVKAPEAATLADVANWVGEQVKADA